MRVKSSERPPSLRSPKRNAPLRCRENPLRFGDRSSRSVDGDRPFLEAKARARVTELLPARMVGRALQCQFLELPDDQNSCADRLRSADSPWATDNGRQRVCRGGNRIRNRNRGRDQSRATQRDRGCAARQPAPFCEVFPFPRPFTCLIRTSQGSLCVARDREPGRKPPRHSLSRERFDVSRGIADHEDAWPLRTSSSRQQRRAFPTRLCEQLGGLRRARLERELANRGTRAAKLLRFLGRQSRSNIHRPIVEQYGSEVTRATAMHRDGPGLAK